MNNNNFDELESYLIVVDNQSANMRIDKFLSTKFIDYSRNYIQDLIKDNYVFVNNKNVKASYKIVENDEILIYFKEDEQLSIEPENIDLDIIYQDKDIAIINKEAGMVVHPSPGHYKHTLVNAILYHIKDLSSINGIIRPGIVHRLDMDTSGLLVIAKNDYAHNFLSMQLKDHSMSRTYIALVKGVLDSKKGMIKTLIARDPKNRLKMAVVNDNGKEAITEFEVIETYNNKYSLVKCHLLTGRTHQIRVHMDFIKHPIINDPLYGSNNKIDFDCKQLLHACKLELTHPTTKKIMVFEAKLPKHFIEAIDFIKNNS